MRYLPLDIVGTKGLGVSLRDKNGKVLFPIGSGISKEKIQSLKEEYTGLYIQSDDKPFSPFKDKGLRAAFISALHNLNNNLSDMTKDDLDRFSVRIEEYIKALIEEVKNAGSLPLNILHPEDTENYLISHQIDTSYVCIKIGLYLNLDELAIKRLAVGGMFCDIGKAFLPKPIFVKKDLTKEEWEMMKTHTAYGSNLIKNYTQLSDAVADIVLYHHERLDGSGYPYGLSEVPFLAQIAGAADTFAAMLYEKDYRLAKHPEEIVDFFGSVGGEFFDSNICNAIKEMTDKYSLGSFVELKDGRFARLMQKKDNGKYIGLVYADRQETFTYSYEDEVRFEDIKKAHINLKKVR
jgi:HD-GYP domain-containing protein (c-di-GMP phosphodiesterase class II)